MKILQVIPSFGFGGAETMCENLIYELKDSNHEVIVVSLFSNKTPISERIEKRGVNIVYLGKAKGLDFHAIRRLRKLIKNERPDAIHSHLHALKYCVLADLFIRTKKVHTIHSIAEKESGRIDRFFNRIFFKVNKVIPVALNSLVQKTISNCYSLKEERIPIVFNGCPLGKCTPKKDYHFGDKIKIMHTGSLIPLKNHKSIIDAVLKLHELYSNVSIVFVGDGVLKDELNNYVVENNAVDYIKFYGTTTNVYSLLAKADLFVLASIYEGMPMSIIEAMGTGLPIVASKVGGVPDLIIDNYNGTLCDTDCLSIYGALKSLIESYEKRVEFGMNALVSSEDYSSQKMCENYLCLYKG